MDDIKVSSTPFSQRPPTEAGRSPVSSTMNYKPTNMIDEDANYHEVTLNDDPGPFSSDLTTENRTVGRDHDKLITKEKNQLSDNKVPSNRKIRKSRMPEMVGTSIRGFSDIRRPTKWPFAPILVPIIDWLPAYTKSNMINDLIAGLTVFVLLIPQGMAYAVLAGMPPVYGLYTATIPMFIYALLGTSRQISMGPMAITSLLLGSSAQSLGYVEGNNDYIRCVSNISMLCGIVLFSIGSCRLGIMANFLGHSVLTGFITASALLISVSQLKYITGIPVPRFTYTHQTLIYLLSHLNECNPFALAIGLTAWIALYGVKVWKKRNKSTPEKMRQLWFRMSLIAVNMSSLLAIILGAIVAYALVSNGNALQIVGYVPAGLKAPSFEFLDIETVLSFLPSAFIIAIISFAGNWAVAKKFAAQNKYEVDATQELIAQGLTNIIGALFNSFVVSGGLARSAVNAESGAQTQISGCIAALCIMISLELFTPIFYYIPMAMLGAIIEVSVASMIDFDEMIKAYRIDKKDCAVMAVTFFCTFFIGISQGILIGVILSITFVMNASAFPHVAHLGQLPSELGGYYRDVSRFKEAEQLPRIAIVRMDASLYFANAAYFKEIVFEASQGKYHTNKTPIQLIILDVSAWIDIDLSGINTLTEIHSELLKSNIQLAFANAKGCIRDRLKTTEFIQKIGEGYLSDSIDDAVRRLNWRRSTLDLEVLAVESDFKLVNKSLSGRSFPSELAKSSGEEDNTGFEAPARGLSLSTTINALHRIAQVSNEDETFVINPLSRGYNEVPMTNEF